MRPVPWSPARCSRRRPAERRGCSSTPARKRARRGSRPAARRAARGGSPASTETGETPGKARGGRIPGGIQPTSNAGGRDGSTVECRETSTAGCRASRRQRQCRPRVSRRGQVARRRDRFRSARQLRARLRRRRSPRQAAAGARSTGLRKWSAEGIPTPLLRRLAQKGRSFKGAAAVPPILTLCWIA